MYSFFKNLRFFTVFIYHPLFFQDKFHRYFSQTARKTTIIFSVIKIHTYFLLYKAQKFFLSREKFFSLPIFKNLPPDLIFFLSLGQPHKY